MHTSSYNFHCEDQKGEEEREEAKAEEKEDPKADEQTGAKIIHGVVYAASCGARADCRWLALVGFGTPCCVQLVGFALDRTGVEKKAIENAPSRPFKDLVLCSPKNVR